MVPENIHTPPRKVAGISEGEGGQREKFPREGGAHVELLSRGCKRGLVPDLSPARRLVTRGFAARATSFITTKMRACSQAKSDGVWYDVSGL